MKEISTFSESGLGLEYLHEALLDAFSDYVIPLQPSEAQFATLLNSRGFDADASMVACYGGKIAAKCQGKSGLIHQIAAKTPDTLQALLAAASTDGLLRLINMDSADQILRATLEVLGAKLVLRQSEMRRPI